MIIRKTNSEYQPQTVISEVFTNDKRNLISKIDKVILNNNRIDKISLLFENDYDKLNLRDVINFSIDKSHNVVENVLSSFTDNHKFVLSDLINDVCNKYTDFDNLNEIYRNSIDLMINSTKDLYLSDNRNFIDTIDYLVNTLDINNDLEYYVLYLMIIIFTLPLVHIPFYLNVFIDFSNIRPFLSSIRYLSMDTEIKESTLKIIDKMMKLVAFNKDLIGFLASNFKKSWKIMVNINYYETNMRIYYNNKDYCLLSFNVVDHYRILRLLGVENKYVWNLLDQAKKLNLNTISSSIHIQNKNEYILEYYKNDSFNRIEDVFNFD